jgi:hypothetical protein
VKGLDLGELMKDVGLDLEGFDDPASSQLISNVMETSQDGSQQQVAILRIPISDVLGKTFITILDNPT